MSMIIEAPAASGSPGGQLGAGVHVALILMRDPLWR
jgi:hypothetical protein